jgi:ABC-type cobalamin/Fe3+-siderophores transport system ATPase subunit
MIELNNLSLSINRRLILRDITMTLNDGEIIGIIGQTGAGKTMLLKTMAGQITGHSGTISVGGAVRSAGQRLKKNDVSYYDRAMPNNLDETLYDFLLLARVYYKKFLRPFADYDRQVAEDYLALLNLDAYRSEKLCVLPDGIFKRALIAHVLIRDSAAVFLDNPTNDLDIVSLKLLKKALMRYVMDGNRIVVVCSNDINFIAQTADRLLVMDNGRIAETGTADILNSEMIKRHFGIDTIISRNVYTGRPEVHFFPDA